MTIARKQRARAKYQCDTCYASIKKGSTYWRISLPPHAEPLYAPGWRHLKQCGRFTWQCPLYWNIDARVASNDPLLVDVWQ